MADTKNIYPKTSPYKLIGGIVAKQGLRLADKKAMGFVNNASINVGGMPLSLKDSGINISVTTDPRKWVEFGALGESLEEQSVGQIKNMVGMQLQEATEMVNKAIGELNAKAQYQIAKAVTSFAKRNAGTLKLVNKFAGMTSEYLGDIDPDDLEKLNAQAGFNVMGMMSGNNLLTQQTAMQLINNSQGYTLAGVVPMNALVKEAEVLTNAGKNVIYGTVSDEIDAGVDYAHQAYDNMAKEYNELSPSIPDTFADFV